MKDQSVAKLPKTFVRGSLFMIVGMSRGYGFRVRLALNCTIVTNSTATSHGASRGHYTRQLQVFLRIQRVERQGHETLN